MPQLAPAPLPHPADAGLPLDPRAAIALLDIDLRTAEPAHLVVVQDAAPTDPAIRRARLLVMLLLATMFVVIPANAKATDATSSAPTAPHPAPSASSH